MLLLHTAALSFAKPMQAAFSRHAKYTVLPVPPLASISDWEPSGTISPNGRWLAYFDARPKNHDKVVFYDLVKRQHWIADAGRIVTDSFSTRVLTWRRDSHACAIGASGGWRIAWPNQRKTQCISRTVVGLESCAAWSPHSNRLAMFEGFLGNGLYRVWDGRRLTKGVEWREAVDYPAGDARAWQCERSPDEKLILFRFYGHAVRNSYSPGHTVVVNPRTGRRRFNWGAEAGPARWLDKSRLIFDGDDEGTGFTNGLMVAKPVARQSNNWLKNAVTWALSPQRDALWALTTKGELFRTSTQKRHWRIVRRSVVSSNALRFSYPSLHLSPRGDMAAFCNMFGGRSISIVSTSRQHPWTINWRAPVGKVKILGWASGKTLPLLELKRNEEAPAVVIQLEK